LFIKEETMIKVTAAEGMKMLNFLQKNINNADAIAREYHAHREYYDALAIQYPQYRTYLNRAPKGMIEKLKALGVPL
jgi:hypothetical protein